MTDAQFKAEMMNVKTDLKTSMAALKSEAVVQRGTEQHKGHAVNAHW